MHAGGGAASLERCTSLVGTLPYVAPEVLGRTGHGCACDWWSLECCSASCCVAALSLVLW